LALQLAQCGVKTLILSARKQPELEQVSTQCQEKAPTFDVQVMVLLADLSDKASVAKLAKEALELCPTGVDVLINNGGVSSRSNFVDTSIEIDEKVMQINFLAGAALAKAVVPGMIQKGEGAIIWISSVQGLLAIPSRTSYCASKHAVQGKTQQTSLSYCIFGSWPNVFASQYIMISCKRIL
jgi:short-subunit dehydrogenase